jgi:YD repeat-containing protein
VVSTRQVSYDGNTVAQSQSFSYSTTWANGDNAGTWTTKTTSVTTTDKITGKSALTTYTYQPGYLTAPSTVWGSVAPEVPVEQTVARYDWGNTTTPLDVETKGWYTNTPQVSQLACDFHTLNGNSAFTSGHFYQYDCAQNACVQVSDDKEYDFGQITSPSTVCTGSSPTAPTSIVPIRETAKTFTTFTSPEGVTFAKPYTVIVYGNGTKTASTYYYYDQWVLATLSAAPPPTATHDETSFPASVVTNRGNATMVTRVCTGCTNSTTKYTYDKTGQLATMIDPCGNTTCSDLTGSTHTTTYSFVDSPSDATSAGNSNAYLTQVTDPLGHTENYQYNYVPGQLTQVEDENQQITTYDYTDPLFRPTDVYEPASIQNGNAKPHTQYSYVDGIGASATTTTPTGVVSKKLFDGMGHTIQTQLTTDPGGIDYVDTVYDGMGHAYSSSNPFRTEADPTYGITYYTYDGLGRKILQLQPDNVTTQSTTNGTTTTNYSSSQQWSYSGNVVSFTDEIGNQWARTSDALGRLTKVVEPGSRLTSYTYDALNNLLTVSQAGAGSDTAINRSFSYDSLARLLSANNPETGLVCYGVSSSAGCSSTTNGYDVNGNLIAKTDARGVTTSYTYDVLDRLLSKNSSGALSSCFLYDGSEANGTGRLVKEWTNSSCSASGFFTLRSISAYDEMGRIASEQQCTPGNCTASTGPQLWYGYDLSGDTTCLANSAAPPSLNGVTIPNSPSCLNGAVGSPSGLLLTTSFDLGAHMNSVTSNASAYPTSIYTLRTSPTYGYGPVGPLYWTLGTGLSLNESYTNRSRVNSFGATSTTP